ncbi:MFS transporter, partial [Streptomyces sp900116325]
AVFGPATDGHGDRLAILLLVFGVTGTFGNVTAGFIADRQSPRRVIAIVTVLLTAVFLIVPQARMSFAAALPVVAVVGWVSWSVTTPQQHRLMAFAPGSESLVISLNAAAVYLAVSLSGVIGAVGLHTFGPGRLPLIAAAFVVAAVPFTWQHGRIKGTPNRTKERRKRAML